MIHAISGVAAAVAVAASLTVAAPAHADVVGVNSCSATATNGRATCTFVSTGGTRVVEIFSTARYAWARVTCVPNGGYAFVDVWDTEGGYDFRLAFIPPGVCTLEVAADGGTATGVVR